MQTAMNEQTKMTVKTSPTVIICTKLRVLYQAEYVNKRAAFQRDKIINFIVY